jgi:transposase
VLLAQNIGEYCSIDETQLCEDVYTILSNKAGHGKKGTVIAVIRGTKASVVSQVIKKIPVSELARVKEITMDFSDSMYNIAKQCFPNADIVIDCFHIVQRLCEGLEEIRLKFKRPAMTESKKAAAAFARNEDRKARQRLYYRKKHKRNPKESRGRKQLYKPVELSNGDTKVELLTRSRNLLSQSGEKWGEHKKERARLLFELYPQLKEGYSLVCKVRSVFKEDISVDEARKLLHEWYQDVSNCSLREVKAARDCIKSKEKEVLNYFINRSTNASAESLNSKMKGFRAQLHGIADIPFFMYRLCKIFGLYCPCLPRKILPAPVLSPL